jgi:recyclin-1
MEAAHFSEIAADKSSFKSIIITLPKMNLLGTRRREASNQPPKHISALPPTIISRIFQFLPVPVLPLIASVSRRFKVLCYQDEIYQEKLRLLNMQSVVNVEEKQHASLKDSLQARLRQLPGGQFLPTKDKIINSLEYTTATADAVVSPESIASPDSQSITATLPDIKTTHLIIGSGGLKAALRKASKPKDKNKSTLQRHLDSNNEKVDGMLSRSAREAFRKVYIELYPYYVDFAKNSNDSRVFKDYKDLSEIAAVLQRLVLFDRALFLGRDTTDITSNLNSTVEWFESRLLGQFDAAFDRKDYEDMRINAQADFYLNGGLGCVNVFISKNPGITVLRYF